MTINGEYELASSENFEAYLTAVGIGAEGIQLSKTLKPIIQVTENGNKYVFETKTSVKNLRIEFEDGKEFTEETADGRKVQSTITRHGNAFTHTQTLDGHSGTKTHTFTADALTTVFQAGGVTATRVYKRL